MACGKLAFFLAAILAVVSITRADEEESDFEGRASFQGPAGNFGFSMGSGSLPSFGELFGSSNGSNPFESFLSAFRPNSGGSNGTGSNSISSFLPFLSGNRLEEIPAPATVEISDSEETNSSDSNRQIDNPESRLFFGFLSNLFSTPTSCNFTTQPGTTCLSCTQRLQCFSANTGRLTQCSFLTPYCNNGYCSKIPGVACYNTTTV